MYTSLNIGETVVWMLETREEKEDRKFSSFFFLKKVCNFMEIRKYHSLDYLVFWEDSNKNDDNVFY